MQMIKYKDVEFTTEQFQQMIDGGMVGEKNDTVQSAFMQPPHGYNPNWGNTGGLLARPGVRPDMYSVVPALVGNLFSDLYVGTTTEINPEYEIITGVKAATGSNPTSFCGTPSTAGDAKVATHRSQFGELFMGTDRIILNKAGGHVNRADMDRQLINNVAAMSPIAPDIMRNPDINSETGLELFKFVVEFIRTASRVLHHGNATLTNVNTEIGWIKEFDGIDRLFKTGYVDLESGNAVPSIDSKIFDFANADATVAANGIVDLFSQIDYQLMDDASVTGLEPLVYGIAMPRAAFWALTTVWPCSYLTNGCQVEDTTTGRVNVSGTEQVQMRDSMRTGKFLWVNGRQVPVYLEDGIEQTTEGPGLSTSIRFIPFFAGGRRVTYIEAFDQQNTRIQQFLNAAAVNNYRTSNGGLWAMTHRQTGFCYELLFAAQPRLVARTPFLGARIENLVYKLTHGYPRAADPSDPYHLNGGRYVSSPYGGA
jgi:hypothetical protein